MFVDPTMLRTVHKVAALCALAVPALLWSPSANAATTRWNQPQYSPTQDQGLYFGGVNLSNRQVLRSASVPSFTFEGKTYHFTESHRVGEPVVTDGIGFTQVSAPYVVPVDGGVVKATLSYTLSDRARVNPDAGQLSAWIDFAGPRGDYSFRWRLDLDVGASSSDVVELSDGGEAPRLLEKEGVVELFADTQLDVVDAFSYQREGRVAFVPQEMDNPRAYVSIHAAGELDAAAAVADQAKTDDPSDTVVWYETRLYNTTGGLTGPDLEATTASRVNAVMEQDKMTSAPWISSGVTVYGEFRSIESGFATANINVTNIYRSDANIADDSSSSNAEMHSMMLSKKNYENLDTSSNWYSWLGQVLASSSGQGVLGIMFDDGATNTDGKPRQGCAAFYEAHNGSWPEGDSVEAELILTATHEQGHVYNQHHEDFCPTQGWKEKATFRANSAIMGYAFMDTSNWTFGWNSIETMTEAPEEYVRPGHGLGFTGNGGSPGYACWEDHCTNHASTSCRRFCCR